jgi:hypothetical protein
MIRAGEETHNHSAARQRHTDDADLQEEQNARYPRAGQLVQSMWGAVTGRLQLARPLPSECRHAAGGAPGTLQVALYRGGTAFPIFVRALLRGESALQRVWDAGRGRGGAPRGELKAILPSLLQAGYPLRYLRPPRRSAPASTPRRPGALPFVPYDGGSRPRYSSRIIPPGPRYPYPHP